MQETISGLVFDLHRGTTHDGPGLRTTAFFKGCPLRCAWCQNPEGIDPRPMPIWNERLCIGCGCCVAACKYGALSAEAGGIRRDIDRCRRCMECTKACPSGAMKETGTRFTIPALSALLSKDQKFFDEFEGGVTLSGGEAMLQPEFAVSLLAELKRRGIHTALDTSGLFSEKWLDALYPVTDLFLYDLKLMDAKLHKLYTGVDNALILENFSRICAHIRQEGVNRLWVRTPLIPGATATPENIHAIGEFLVPYRDAVERWELCAFNNVCRDKYRQLQTDWSFKDQPLMSQNEIQPLENIARAQLGTIVLVSGLIAKE